MQQLSASGDWVPPKPMPAAPTAWYAATPDIYTLASSHLCPSIISAIVHIPRVAITFTSLVAQLTPAVTRQPLGLWACLVCLMPGYYVDFGTAHGDCSLDCYAPSLCLPAAEALRRIGEPAVAPLMEALSDADVYVRMCAARALGQLGDEPTIRPLIEAAASNFAVWFCTTEALKEIGKPALEPLVEALSDGNMYMQLYAAETLGMIGDNHVIGALIESLADSNSSVRASAAEALGHIGDNRAVAPLIEATRDVDVRVADNAAIALGRISAPSGKLSGKEVADIHVHWRAECAHLTASLEKQG